MYTVLVPCAVQILANPNHQFNSSALYKNVTLVAWDPAPYAVNLHKVSTDAASFLFQKEVWNKSNRHLRTAYLMFL